MSASSIPAVIYDANPTLGALMVAVLISCFLFGILTVQANYYYAMFSHDPFSIKFLVAFIWLFELGHLISVSQALHFMTISEYGQPDKLTRPPNSLGIAILLSGFIASFIQVYFAYRIRELSGNIYGSFWSSILFLLSLARFIGSIAVAAESFKMTSLAKFDLDFRWLVTATLAVGTCTDIVVTGLLFYYSRPKKSSVNGCIARINDQLVTWTLRTGLIISLFSVTVLVCFLAVRNAFIWQSLYAILARIFSNFLLSSLNARRNKPTVDTQSSTEPSTLYSFQEELSTPRFAPPSLKETPTALSTRDTLGTALTRFDELDTGRTTTFSHDAV